MTLPAPRGLEAVGAYHLLEDLGAAPWGTVYQALDTRCDLTVLLKLVPPSLCGSELDGTSWDAALAATEALGRIYHRHLPAVAEIAEDGEGGLLIAFAPAGHTLRDLLEAGGGMAGTTAGMAGGPARRWSAERIADWGERLADALAEAHAHGLAHGHIREDEVILDPEGEPVLAGFGLTRLAFEPAAPSPAAAVSPLGPPGAGDDVAALAALLQRLGRTARLGDDEPVMRALARFAAPGAGPAADLAEALRRAADLSRPSSTPAGAVPVDLPAAAADARVRGDRRNVLLLLAAALLLVLLALAAGWLLVRHDPPAPPAAAGHRSESPASVASVANLLESPASAGDVSLPR